MKRSLLCLFLLAASVHAKEAFRCAITAQASTPIYTGGWSFESCDINGPVTDEAKRTLEARRDRAEVVIYFEGTNADLATLSKLPFITRLGTRGADDLAPLRELKQLKALHVDGAVKDLSVLTALPIERLGLSDVEPAQLEILPKLTRLRALEISVPFTLEQLGPIVAASKLSELVIDKTRDLDLSPLAKLPLTSLMLFDWEGKDPSPLSKLTRLESLTLADVKIQDLGIVGKLAKLKALTIRSCPVKSLAPLKSLHNLKELDLDGVALTDARDLAALAPNLSKLAPPSKADDASLQAIKKANPSLLP
jgi:Leucine-rich repeat (LRR) protein